MIIVGVLWAYVWIKAEKIHWLKEDRTRFTIKTQTFKKNGLKYTAQFYYEFNVETKKNKHLLNEHH